MTRKEMAAYIDHTLLSPHATSAQVESLCKEAADAGFASACVQPGRAAVASRALSGTGVALTVVVGFPQGANTPSVKAFETREAISLGAQEIDMVINLGALREGDLELVREDIAAVREASRGYVLKVIIESSSLSEEEIRVVCAICKELGCDFVKTSTGFGGGGASVEAVRLMKESFGGKVKASGGIRTLGDALEMIEAGADRLGASAGMSILEEIEE